MSDIFLSYANEDLPRVLPLVHALEQHGWSVWWDRTIPPGQTFDALIEQALAAARCVVVVWSRTAVASRGVRTEANAGLQKNILIPVVIEEALTIPQAFRMLQAARLHDWHGTEPHLELTKLIQAVTDLIGPPQQSRLALPASLTDPFGIEFALIPAGEFLMGSTAGHGDEQPVHRAQISQPFYLGIYPVTQGQWQAVMQNNPSHFTGDATRPVERVSWEDVQAFLQRLNSRETRYRLPTEAKWEYAARAGSTTAYSFGDDAAELCKYAWYREIAGGTTHPVGELQPNAWGLYDMHGNIWEWVQDWYREYDAVPVVDPTGPVASSHRVVRGGGWRYGTDNCRSAYRLYLAPGGRSADLGFRLVRTAR